MGRKIFASYKYADKNVKELGNKYRVDDPTYPSTFSLLYPIPKVTTVRSYVDKLQDLLDKNDHINKGEKNGEDLSHLSENTIKEKLKDKIHDSSLTIVFISQNMKDFSKLEKNQWIPWEISYSLKDIERGGLRSRTNAILAVVIPDICGTYNYFEDYNGNVKKYNLFNILAKNMDNRENWANTNEKSYIKTIKWSSFIGNINYYIEKAIEIKSNINDYKVVKEI